jgi:feruloyl esterase
MWQKSLLLMVLTACLPAAHAAAPAARPAAGAEQFACHALKIMNLSEAAGAGVKLTDVDVLPAAGDQPVLCRVNGVIEPKVGFEVRMPLEGWNGRLLVTGCSNLCGILQIQGMEDALARGYAAATTDMGHHTGDTSDARWALNNPALEIDFGHRATHVSTLVAKELIANYYGNPPGYAYFRGCSTGGRQALVAAERYPEDFNGIIAGAPFNQALSVPHMAWVMAANTGADGKAVLDKAAIGLLGKAALAACDGEDGTEDGVIGNPEACNFRPATLQCRSPVEGGKGGAQRDCLTPAQVEAAVKIYAGPHTTNGTAWSSGGSPVGSEFTWAKSLLAAPGATPFFQFITQNWLKHLAFVPDPVVSDEQLLRIDFDAGPVQFAATSAVVGFRPALGRFRDLGGRLIIYHGWVDQSLMPAHTLDYWRDAGERMGGDERLGEFARLFMVPGMLHCGAGPGAADIDFLTALERWVEADEAPASLLAHKVREPVPTMIRQPRFPLSPASVEYVRPVYPYPRRAP